MALISVSESPHIRQQESVKTLSLKIFFAALLPVIVRLCLTPFTSSLQILGVAAGVWMAGFLTSRFFPPKKADSPWILASLAAILVALLPLSGTFFMGFTSGAILVIFGTLFSGRYASLIFHPAVLACALVSKIWPQDFLMVSDLNHGTLLFAAAATGGILLCIARVISWRIPAIFLSILALGFFVGIKPTDLLNEGRLGVLAFFVLTDSATSPLKLGGRMGFSFLGAVLALILCPFISLSTAALFSLLIMNAAVSWFDLGKFQ